MAAAAASAASAAAAAAAASAAAAAGAADISIVSDSPAPALTEMSPAMVTKKNLKGSFLLMFVEKQLRVCDSCTFTLKGYDQ